MLGNGVFRIRRVRVSLSVGGGEGREGQRAEWGNLYGQICIFLARTESLLGGREKRLLKEEKVLIGKGPERSRS